MNAGGMIPSGGFAKYWNDETLERQKPYGVESADDRRLLDYVGRDTNLQRCFEAALDYAASRFGALTGRVADIGAGVCWTTALISRHPGVDRVLAIDYSAHRLLKIAPLVIRQFDGLPGRIDRHCGAMETLPADVRALDLAVFCQSLYMCEDPVALLREVRQRLRPGGVVLVACERVEADRGRDRWRRLAARLHRESPAAWPAILRRRVPDQSGRYPYVTRDYRRFFREAGLTFHVQELDFPLLPESRLVAMNYFGVNDAKTRTT
jgi:SAM-dependent methyltransferase